MARKPDDHILKPESLRHEHRLSSTSITVHTRKELRQAVEAKAAEIVIDDPALVRALERSIPKSFSSRFFLDPTAAPVFRYNVKEKVSAWSVLQNAITPTRFVLALLGLVVFVFLLLVVFGTEISLMIFGLLLALVLLLSAMFVVLTAIDEGYDEIGVLYEWGKDSKTGQILLKRRSNGGGEN